MTTFKSLAVPLSFIIVGGVYVACGSGSDGGGGGASSSADLTTANSIDI